MEENGDNYIEESENEENESNNNSSISDEESQNKWKIEYTKEKKFWENIVIPSYIYIPELCPTCKKGKLQLKESKNKNLLNPFYLRCKFKKCKNRKSLRHYSFLKLHKFIPASIIFEIFNSFIIIKQNAKQIYEYLKSKFANNLSYPTICKILNYIRHVIADYIKQR